MAVAVDTCGSVAELRQPLPRVRSEVQSQLLLDVVAPAPRTGDARSAETIVGMESSRFARGAAHLLNEPPPLAQLLLERQSGDVDSEPNFHDQHSSLNSCAVDLHPK